VFIKNDITSYRIVWFEFIFSVYEVNKVMQLWGDNDEAAVGISLFLCNNKNLNYSDLRWMCFIGTVLSSL